MAIEPKPLENPTGADLHTYRVLPSSSTLIDEGEGNPNEWQEKSRDRGSGYYQDALEMARNGWGDAPKLEDGADEILSLETETVAGIDFLQSSSNVSHGVTGAFVDMGRYLEGHPECMMEFSEPASPRVFRLAYQINQSAFGREQQKWRGAVVLALINAIAAGGNSLAVYAYQSSVTPDARRKQKKFGEPVKDEERACFVFPIKRESEPIETNLLAFWTAHSSANTELVWSFRENQNREYCHRFGCAGAHGGFAVPMPITDVPGMDWTFNDLPRDLNEARQSFRQALEAFRT